MTARRHPGSMSGGLELPGSGTLPCLEPSFRGTPREDGLLMSDLEALSTFGVCLFTPLLVP